MTITDTTAAGSDARPPFENKTPIEIWKPETSDLKGYFDVEVLDPNGQSPNNIIKEVHDWQVRFHVFLVGDIWKCVSGTLCFDVVFIRAKTGDRLMLSDLVGSEIEKEFKGCYHFENGVVHVQHTVNVEAGKLPAGAEKPAIYDWRGVLSYRDPCNDPGVMTSYDSGLVQVWGH